MKKSLIFLSAGLFLQVYSDFDLSVLPQVDPIGFNIVGDGKSSYLSNYYNWAWFGDSSLVDDTKKALGSLDSNSGYKELEDELEKISSSDYWQDKTAPSYNLKNKLGCFKVDAMYKALAKNDPDYLTAGGFSSPILWGSYKISNFMDIYNIYLDWCGEYYPQGILSGSYSNSCKNCVFKEGVFSCDCLSRSGSQVQTSLKIQEDPALVYISNENGVLTERIPCLDNSCPSGSYLHTCDGCVLKEGVLSCDYCLPRNGKQTTSLKISGDGDIFNENGVLKQSGALRPIPESDVSQKIKDAVNSLEPIFLNYGGTKAEWNNPNNDPFVLLQGIKGLSANEEAEIENVNQEVAGYEAKLQNQ